ncbi:MAG: RsmE family RNA methyltransferase [Halarcobacter sp.]
MSEKIVENAKKLHLAWCVVDPKTVEKNIASLNEFGLDKITFISCEYSQKNFKINLEKLEKILLNSSSQCGRSSIIKLENRESLDKFLSVNNPNSFTF